ncbi:MAG: tetratricopeptide repeat protein [Fuerstiella sp.]|nr:tetratricopeptide repeat protein [Fuerstiella sp.]
MRNIFLSVCILAITGCGSETPQSEEVASGVTLNLQNPDREQTVVPRLSQEERKTIEQLIASARQAADLQKSPQAIEALSQAIGIDPSDTRLLRMRADIYASAGELASARADFSSAILSDPVNAALRNVRGYFLMTNGVYEDALSDFAEAIRLDPRFAVAWNNRGLVYLRQGKFSEAVEQFTMAVECDPECVDGWNNIGFAQMKQGNLKQALLNIERAIQLNPSYVAAWNNRGLINLRLKDYEAACTAFTKAIEHDDLDARWYGHRQVALRELKRFDEVAADQRTIAWIQRLTQLTRHLNRNQKDAARWVDRGDCLAVGERYEAAINNYTNALTLEPSNTDALNARARIHAQTGHLQKALDDCEKSLVIEASLEAFSIRGETWLVMNNLDQAIEDFESARRLDETFAQAYRDRGARRHSNGDQTGAEKDFQAAQRIEDALAGRLPSTNTEPIPFPESE